MGLYNRDYGRQQTPWERGGGGNHYGDSGGGFGWSSAAMVTKLIIITLVAWLMSIVLGDIGGGEAERSWVYDGFALHDWTLLRPWWWFQFLSYGFLHSAISPMHLFGNMLGLYFFGRAIEAQRGGGELLRLYLVSMVVAGMVGSAYYLFRGDNGETVGASGAVAAITIVFALANRNEIINLMFVLPIPAWLFAAGFVLYNLYGARNSMYGIDLSHTAFAVHLAGIAFGAAYYFGRWDLSFLSIQGVEDWPRKFRDRARRTKLKVHDPDRKIARNEADADQVLDKIHREGEASLTAAERKILNRYSRDQRKRRGER